ncbi:MAG: hypothetical protein ACRCWQ_14465 [Bacilli bacterium]
MNELWLVFRCQWQMFRKGMTLAILLLLPVLGSTSIFETITSKFAVLLVVIVCTVKLGRVTFESDILMKGLPIKRSTQLYANMILIFLFWSYSLMFVGLSEMGWQSNSNSFANATIIGSVLLLILIVMGNEAENLFQTYKKILNIELNRPLLLVVIIFVTILFVAIINLYVGLLWFFIVGVQFMQQNQKNEQINLMKLFVKLLYLLFCFAVLGCVFVFSLYYLGEMSEVFVFIFMIGFLLVSTLAMGWKLDRY